MKRFIKNALLNNLTIKIVAFIFGYSFWFICSQSHSIQATFNIPICFYNQQEAQTIQAPELIRVTVQGRRSQLYAMNTPDLALHVDTQQLLVGPNQITPSDKNLFLPDTVKLIHYKPSNLIITLHNQLPCEL